MSDDGLSYDGIVEDISSGADAAQKVAKGFFPKTLGLFDDALYNWLRPKFTQEQAELIEKHITEATDGKNLLIQDRPAKLSDVSALIEWVDQVKDLNPEQYPHASERWQKALRDVLVGSRDMLLAMQKVRPETIERFADTGTITLDDAIEFEKLGLGAIQNPLRTFTHHTSKRDEVRFALWAVGTMVIFAILPAISGVFLLKRIGLSDDLSSVGMLLGAAGLFWIYKEFRRFFKGGPKPRYGESIVTESQRLLQSHLGSYVLTTALGDNPNKTVLWDIHPVEEERSLEFIDENPGYRRDM